MKDEVKELKKMVNKMAMMNMVGHMVLVEITAMNIFLEKMY